MNSHIHMNHYEDINSILNRLHIDSIVTNDIDAWTTFKYKNYNKIYNKLWLIEAQNIECGPIGTVPNKYPIVIKPIINLYGMSKGYKKINSESDYYKNQNVGSFWMPYIKGRHYTIDIVFDKGVIIAYYALESKPSIHGTFKYHVYRPNYILNHTLKVFMQTHFDNYTGLMNIEVINNSIIEGHLRFNGDCYLYNDIFFKNIDCLMNGKSYTLKVKKKKLYLFPFFITGTIKSSTIHKHVIEDLLIKHGITNIRWDDTTTLYQRDDLRRLFMFKVDTLSKGMYIIEQVQNILFVIEQYMTHISN